MKMHHYAGVICLFAAGSAWTEVPAERAVKYRQSAYYLMGQHLSQINAVIKGDVPYDKASVAVSAEMMEMMSRVVFDSFPAGSDTGATKAKPEIWKEMDKFRQLSRASQVEMDKLLAASKTGDMALLKTHFSNVSKSCKQCHDQYKAK